MKTALLILFGFLIFNLPKSVWSNPFSCKIPVETEAIEETKMEPLTYKGFMALDNQTFGFIQIGENDYEVAVGDNIKGFTILKISKVHLRYRYMQKVYHSLLESD